MSLKVYTCSFGYRGNKPRLDTTVKTAETIGDYTWCPSKRIVYGIKYKEMLEEEYIKEYYRLMRESYKNNRSKWDELLAQDEVVLVCYCGKDKFCHRHLLKDILIKLGATDGGEIGIKD